MTSRPAPIDAPCEICGHVSYASVSDHCHDHNQVRGVLCTSCNVLMGRIDRGLAPRNKRVDLRLLVQYRNRCAACPSMSIEDLDHSIQPRPTRQRGPRKPGTSKILFVRMSDDLLQWLRTYAHKQEVTMSTAARMLINQELDKDGES